MSSITHPAPASSGHPSDTPLSRSGVVAVVVGNAMEFYDFVSYAFFAVYIGKAFFPSSTPLRQPPRIGRDIRGGLSHPADRRVRDRCIWRQGRQKTPR
jgi:hypothetical protein